MASTLSNSIVDEIFNRALPTKTPKRITFMYDPGTYDTAIEGMFVRRWTDDDTFLPGAKNIWSALFAPTIGRSLDLEEISIVLAVAQNTRSNVLRDRALGGLRDVLADCSGSIDSRTKLDIRNLIDSLTTTPTPENL